MPCRFHIARVCLYFYQGKEHAKHYCERGKGKQKTPVLMKIQALYPNITKLFSRSFGQLCVAMDGSALYPFPGLYGLHGTHQYA